MNDTSTQPENSSMMPIVVAVIIIIAIVLAVIFFSSNPNPNANNDNSGGNITNTTPEEFATSTMQDLGVTAQYTESNTSTTGDGTVATDTGNNTGDSTVVATESVPMVTGTAETGN